MSLVTSAEVAAYMRVKSTDTESLAHVTTFIAIAEDKISQYVRQEITAQDDVVAMFSGDGGHEYIVSNTPVTDVTALYVRTGFTSDWAEVSTDDYEVNVKATGFTEILNYNTFLIGNHNYKIVYNHGYTTSTVPEDLKESIIRLTVFLLRNSNIKVLGEDRLGLSTISKNSITGAENISTTYVDVWKKVKGDTNKYKALLRLF